MSKLEHMPPLLLWIRQSISEYKILIALTMLCTAFPAHSVSYAIFPPEAVTIMKTRSQKEPEAGSFFATIRKSAAQSLSRAPSALATLEIEGNLSSSDAAISNDDMLAIVALGLDYRLNGNYPALAKADQYLLAWAQTYKPTGNPINEEVFYKYVAGYELVREAMTPSSRATVDNFLRQLFEKEKAYTAARDPAVSHSNWESRHLALVTAIAYTLGDPVMRNYCSSRYREQISYNILPAGTIGSLFPGAAAIPLLATRLSEPVLLGTTWDLIQRDAMEYHVASVQGLVYAAWVARNQGLNWLGVAGDKGQTLRNGLDFTIPYATGAKTYAEFARTIVDFDIAYNRAGPFNSRYAQNLLSIAASLDNRYRVYANSALLPPFDKVMFYSIPPSP